MEKNNIGFFKYENNSLSITQIPYYPITESILKKISHPKYEFENGGVKKIDGKLVVLI
jgi:hypothetical protein